MMSHFKVSAETQEVLVNEEHLSVEWEVRFGQLDELTLSCELDAWSMLPEREFFREEPETQEELAKFAVGEPMLRLMMRILLSSSKDPYHPSYRLHRVQRLLLLRQMMARPMQLRSWPRRRLPLKDANDGAWRPARRMRRAQSWPVQPTPMQTQRQTRSTWRYWTTTKTRRKKKMHCQCWPQRQRRRRGDARRADTAERPAARR